MARRVANLVYECMLAYEVEVDALTYGEYATALTAKDKSNSKNGKKKKLGEEKQEADEGQLDQFFYLEEIGLQWLAASNNSLEK